MWQISPEGVLNKLPIAEFADYETEVHSIDVHPDGRIAVSGAADGTVVFIDMQKNIITSNIRLHNGAINCVQFTPDGKKIVTCSNDRHFKVIDLTGVELFDADLGESLKCLKTDGNSLLLGGERGILRLWDLKAGVEVKQWKCNSEQIQSLECSTNGETVIVSCGASIRVYRIKNTSRSETFEEQHQ